MNIKQIIEKHQEWERDTDGARIGHVVRNFPALARDLSELMEKEAVEFGQWISENGYIYAGERGYLIDPCQVMEGIPQAHLYHRFKFEQWADANGYTKTPGGWITPGGVDVEETMLMEEFKKSV